MKILLLGMGSFATRRVIPALVSSSDISGISIASRRQINPPNIGCKINQCIQGYEKALSTVDCDAVYVSLPNALHFEWVMRALQAGKHVIVDKPAFVCLAEAENALSIADERGLCLAEASVWHYHPQTAAALQVFRDSRDSITHVSAVFTSPPLPPGSFQYSADLGGGALLDRGPYAVSTARWAFGEDPEEVFCRLQDAHSEGVELSFSLLFRFSGGRTLTGFFSLHAEYTNRISLLGDHVRVDIDRVYTPPTDWMKPLNSQVRNQQGLVAYQPADALVEFLRRFADAVASRNYSIFAGPLWSDAVLLKRMRDSATISAMRLEGVR